MLITESSLFRKSLGSIHMD